MKSLKSITQTTIPLYCVKHKYAPGDGIKMDGRKQQNYRRKNWSSLMLFNCGHNLNKKLTPELVNTQTGGTYTALSGCLIKILILVASMKNGTGWTIILQKTWMPRTYTLLQAVLGLKIGSVVGLLMVSMQPNGMGIIHT